METQVERRFIVREQIQDTYISRKNGLSCIGRHVEPVGYVGPRGRLHTLYRIFISTGKIEELVVELKEQYTIVMVTHNMQQALRVSDQTSFFLLGEIVETGPTEKLFSNPREKRTEDYITGRFG